jgi:hypothetical protein
VACARITLDSTSRELGVGDQSDGGCRCMHRPREARRRAKTGDDEILVSAIEEAGATEECDVQWDSLMSGREGPVVKRQWHLLVKKVRASNATSSAVLMSARSYLENGSFA